MRPIYLEIEGLQSFKDKQCIDFDKLGETGLFGIFGPTGSGKSTILDAITLALYGNVLRANRGTQGIVNLFMDSVRVKFHFQLLKSLERTTYVVERSFKRKKGSDTSVEAKIARLYKIEGEDQVIISDKAVEVTQRVTELMGLEQEDFTRSVVLPQNRFHEFLMMDKSKKRDMMERIFYLEEYGRNLTDKLAKKINIVKLELSGVEGSLKSLTGISKEELENKENEHKTAKLTLSDADNMLKVFEEDFKNSSEVWDLSKELIAITIKENDLQYEKPQIESLKVMSDRAIRAKEVEKYGDAYNEVLNNYNQSKEQYTEAEAMYNLCKANEAKFQEKMNYFLLESKTLRPSLIEEKVMLEQGIVIEKEVKDLSEKRNELLSRFKQADKSLKDKEQEVIQIKQSIDSFETKYEAIKKELTQLTVDILHVKKVEEALNLTKRLVELDKEVILLVSKFNSTEQEIELINKSIEGTKKEILTIEAKKEETNELLNKLLGNKPCEKDEINTLSQKLFKAEASVKDLEGLIKQEMDLSSLQDKYKSELISYEKVEKQEAIEVECLAEQRENLLLEIKGLREKELENHATYLVEGLKEGCPCPVCGSLSHPNPAKVSMEDIKDIEKIYETKNLELSKIETRIKERESLILTTRTKIEFINNTLSDNERQLSIIQEDLKQYFEDFQYVLEDKSIVEVKKALEKEGLQIKALDFGITQWEKEIEDTKNNLEALNKELAEAQKVIFKLSTEYEVLTNKRKDIQEDIVLQKKRNNDIKDSKELLLSELNINDIEEENKRLNYVHKNRKEKEIEKDSCEKEIKILRERLEILLAERTQMQENFSNIKNEGEGVRTMLDSSVKRLSSIKVVKSLGEDLDDILQRLKKLDEDERLLTESLKSCQNEKNMWETKVHTFNNQVEIYGKKYELEKEKLKNILEINNFKSLEEAVSMLLDEASIEKIQKDIKEYEVSLSTTLAQKNSLLQRLKGRKINEEEWLDKKSKLEELRAKKEEAIRLLEKATVDYENMKQAYGQWLGYEKQRKVIAHKKEILEQLQKLLKGNSFIEFICEERLRYVAREASETLGELSNYKYAIEIDSENGFVIRDNVNGGALRPVASLSGGETFLTSLSLALALSSQIQLKGFSPLEFFFLDEGFGTLDNKLLDAAIDSLERVASNKKVIGLISHVPQIRSRLGRRLIIDPPSSDGKGSTVRFEKA